MFDSFDERQSL